MKSECTEMVDKENGRQVKWVRTEVNIDNHVTITKLDPQSVDPCLCGISIFSTLKLLMQNPLVFFVSTTP